MLLLLAHELGHYFAFRAYGLPARLPTFVPLLGAFTAGAVPPDLEQDAYIALAGPLVGLGLAAACYAIGDVKHDRFWFAVADLSAFLNLFNMIPMPPFDGGRIIGALWPPLWIAGFLIFVAFAIFMHVPVLFVAIIGLLGLPAMLAAWRGSGRPARGEHDVGRARSDQSVVSRDAAWTLLRDGAVARRLQHRRRAARSVGDAQPSSRHRVDVYCRRAPCGASQRPSRDHFCATSRPTGRPAPHRSPTTIRMVARFGRPNVTCPVSSARVTRSCRSSTRLQPWPRGGFLRGCPTASPQLAGGQFCSRVFSAWSQRYSTPARRRSDRRRFSQHLAVAIGFGPITSDLALGQIALPAFLGAVLVAIIAERSLLVATICGLRCVRAAEPRTRTARSAFDALASRSRCSSPRRLLTRSAWLLLRLRVAARVRPHRRRARLAERFSAIQITAFSIARGLGATPEAARFVDAGVAVLAIAAAITIARRVDNPFARFAAFSALVPFVAGFVHEHDLVVAYPAAIWCALRTRATAAARSRSRARCLVCVDWLGLAQRPSGDRTERVARGGGVRSIRCSRAAIAAARRARRHACIRGNLRRRGLAGDSESRTGLARSARCLSRAAGALGRGHLVRRAGRERIACSGSGLGAAARAIAARLRSARLRYISTSITLSNGVIALG